MQDWDHERALAFGQIDDKHTELVEEHNSEVFAGIMSSMADVRLFLSRTLLPVPLLRGTRVLLPACPALAWNNVTVPACHVFRGHCACPCAVGVVASTMAVWLWLPWQAGSKHGNRMHSKLTELIPNPVLCF